MASRLVSFLLVLVTMAAGAPRPVPHAPATFIVNSAGTSGDATPGDGICDDGSGACTLEAAIEESNANAGADTIHFAIGTGAQTIATGPLPAINDPVTIDGTTQPGYAGTALIRLDGDAGAGTALQMNASNSTIRGLMITRYPAAAITITGSGNLVESCIIGTEATQTQNLGNGADGIRINGGSGNTIRHNVVAFSGGQGIAVYEGGNFAAYPLFTALTPDQTLQVPSADFSDQCGSFRHASGSTILDTSGRAFNENFGMRLTATMSIPMSGTYTFAFDQLDDNGRLVIDAVEQMNVNGGDPDRDVSLFLSAGDHAMEVDFFEGGGAARLLLTASGPGTPAFTSGGNPGWQAELFQTRTAAEGNTISRNSTFDNGGGGIALSCCCRDSNDAGDTDAGPNTFLNHPVFTNSVDNANGTTTVGGTAPPNAVVEIFGSTNDSTPPFDGFGEGKLYLANVTADGGGNFSSNFTLPSSYYSVTATATDAAGNTSEFSANFAVRPRNLQVVNTNDSGPGSLREAIHEANADGVPSLITFDPLLAGASIAVNSSLPFLTGNETTINGDINNDCVPDIELRGNGASFGIVMQSANNVIRGLALNRFTVEQIGIELGGAHHNQILCNHIGLNLAGTAGFGLGQYGLIVRSGAYENTIGGGNVIGGPTVAAVVVENGAGNRVTGNTIGLGTNGSAITSPTGVRVTGANQTVIGAAGQGNRIAATSAGVDVSGSTGVAVHANVIGWPEGSTPVGDGISVHGVATVFIGNTTAAAANTITNNGGAGIRVVSTNTVEIRNNAIWANGGLGIDLGGDGVTPNDGNGDGDTGANTLQNFPVITRAAAVGSSTQVEGFLDTSAGSYHLDFYVSTQADPSGYGEGQTHVFGAPVSGAGPFAFTLPPLPVGSFLTALATGGSNTSEFSLAHQITAPPTAVTELVAWPALPSGIALRWRDPNGSETGFRVERASGPGWVPMTTVGPNVTTWTDTTAGPGSTHVYRVVATSAAGDAPPSNVAMATAYSTATPQFCRTDVSAADWHAAAPSVAHDGANWAMAYADQRNGRASDIFFQQLNADGTPNGPPVQITNDDVPSTNPTLVWNGTNYGLIWFDHLRLPSGSPVSQISFALLGPTGAKVRGDVRVTSTAAAGPLNRDGSMPLIWDGGGWGIFVFEAGSTFADVVFYRLDPDGDVLVNGSHVGALGPRQSNVSAAWNGTEYAFAVVRESSDVSHEIRFRRVMQNGSTPHPSVVLNAGPSPAGAATSIIPDGSGWAVALSALQFAGDTAVFLQRLDAAGSLLGSAVRLSDPGPVFDATPKLVAKSGGGYVVYTTSMVNGVREIGRLEADAAGNKTGSRTLVSTADAFASAHPRVAVSGTTHLLAWNESRVNPSEVADVTVTEGGVVGTINDVTGGHVGTLTSSWPSIIPYENTFVVVYNDSSGTFNRIGARIHYGNGTFNDYRPLHPTANPARRPVAVRNGSELSVVWTDRATGGVHIDRFGASGNSLNGGGVRLGDADVDRGASADFNGELWGVVWVHQGQLRFRRMGFNTPIGPVLTIPSSVQADPQIQWIGSGWALLWHGGGALMYARLDPAGALVVPPVPVTEGGFVYDFHLLFTGEHLGAMWSESRGPTGLDIRFTTLDAGGFRNFPPVSVVSTPEDDRDGAMYYDGANFRIVYSDAVAGLREVQVTPQGSIVPGSRFLGHHAEGRVAAATVGATSGMAWEHRGQIYFQTANCFNDASAPPCPTLNGSFSSGAIQLNWNAVSDPQTGVLGYNLYRDGRLLTELGPATTAHTDTGFTPAAVHTYELRAINGASIESGGCTTRTITAGIAVLPDTLPNARQGSFYEQTFTTQGATGNATFAVTGGALPAGLALTGPGNRNVSGTPTAVGLFQFTVTATDTAAATGSRTYMLRVCPSFFVFPTVLPDPVVNTAYTQVLSVRDSALTQTWSVTSGALPAGLTLSPGGTISGTPGATGVFNFTITAVASNNCANAQAYTLTVQNGNAPRDVRAEGQSTSSILVKWVRPLRGETGFRIERSTDGGATWGSINIVGSDVTSHLDQGLAPQTLYHYRVVAFNGIDSTASATAAAMTFPQGPTLVCAQPIGPYHARAQHPSVAHNGTNWAVVWSERSGNQLDDLRFQLLDNATGAPVGSPKVITQTPMLTRFANLRWNGTNFGVLYNEMMRGPNGEIRSTASFALLDASGNPLRTGVRVYTSSGGFVNDNLELPLVWDGGGWGVFSNDIPAANSTTELYYRRLAPNGDITVPAVRLTNTPAFEVGATATWNGTEYGLAWIEHLDGAYKLLFARVSVTGALAGAPVIVDQAAAGEMLDAPHVLWNGAASEWAVAWVRTGAETIVRFRLLNPDGSPKSAVARLSDDQIAPNDPRIDEIPFIARRSGGGYLVFTASPVTSSSVFDVARLHADAAGNRTGSRVFLTATNDSLATNSVRVATDGTRFMIGHDAAGPTQAEAAVLITDGTGAVTHGPSTITAGHPGGTSSPQMLFAMGANLGAVWVESGGGGGNQLFAKFFDGGGNLVSTKFPLLPSNTIANRFGGTSAGHDFGLAWRDFGASMLKFARFNNTGGMLGPELNVANGSFPGLGWNGEHFGLAFYEGNQLRFQKINSNSTLNGPKVFIGTGSTQVPPLVQWVDRGWAIVWRNDTALFFTLLDRNGAFLVPPQQVTFSGFTPVFPSMAWSGERLGLVWRESRGANPPGDEVWFTALTLEGAKAFPEKVLVGTPNSDSPSGIVWDQNRFRVIYIDGFGGARELSVQADGTILPGTRSWHNRPFAMALAFNGVTLGMLFNSLFDMTLQTSACFTDLTPPPCPSPAVTWDGTKVRVSWVPAPDPESGTFGYNIYRDGVMLAEIPLLTTIFDDFGFVSGATHVYEVRAVNRAGLESAGCTTRTIVAGVTVNPATLPNGSAGSNYNQTLTGSGGTAPYTFAVTAGALPAGLTLTATTGVLSGVPSAAGLFDFTVTATDAVAQSGSRAYSLRVCGGGMGLFPTVLADGYLSTAYSQTVVASAMMGTVTLAITSGSLPAGLALDPTGWIHGTPTATGTASFTITATDSIGCTVARAYTIAIQTGSAVRNLSTHALGTSSIRLRWSDPNRNETVFRIERSTDLGASWTPLTNVGPNTTTFTDGSLSVATAYSYRVVASTPSGDAPPSNVGTATTWPSAAAKTCLQQIGPYHAFARSPAVERAGSQWAMVYQDRSGGGNDEIWFSFLDANGARTGSPVRLSDNDSVSLRPSLRWNGSKFGVLWFESLRGPGGELVHPYRFALLDANGAVVRRDVRIPTSDVQSAIGSDTPLFWDGSGWGFFEAHLTNDGLYDIFFYRLDEDGDLIAGPVRLTSHADFDFQVAVAWNGSEYGMAWLRAHDQNTSVLFQRVSSTGALVGSPVTVTTAANPDRQAPDIVAAPSGWTVTWTENEAGEELAAFLQRLGPTGTPLGPATRISDDFDSNNPTPMQPVADVVTDTFALPAGGYAVFVRSISAGRNEVGLLRADASGNRIGARTIVSTNDAFASAAARAATDGTNFLVAYNEGRLGTQEIADVIVSSTGAIVAGPTDLTTGHSPGNAVGIGTSGQQSVVPLGAGFLTLWTEPVAGDTQVYAKIFDATGTLSATRFPLTTTGVRGRSGVAGVGNTFAVAFRNASNNIVFRRYDAAGNPLMAETTPVTGVGGTPAILLGFDGENYGVAWVQGGRVNFQRVTPAGAALGARSTLAPFTSSNALQMAWTGSGWAMLFVSAGDVYYALLDAAGAVIVAPIRISFTPDQNKEGLALAWNGDVLGMAWGSRPTLDPQGLQVRFTVAGLDGIKLFNELTVSEGVFDTSVQSLNWTGDRFRLAFNSGDTFTLRELDLSAAGSILGPSRLLANRSGASSLVWNGATTAVLWTQLGELWFETTACLDDATAPSCPNVSAARDASGVTLSWPAVSDAESGIYRYYVYRDGALLGETAATSYKDTGVRAGDQHTYRVTVANGAFRESAGCSTFTLIGVPSGLVATFASPHVQVTWQPVQGATSYNIERSANGTTFTSVGTSTTASFDDTTALAQTAYLYRVFAVTPQQTTGPSNRDLATTMTFTDDPLTTSTIAKAVHLSQLRQAAGAVRTLAQLGTFTYSDAGGTGALIRASHVTELRTALNQALTALALPLPSFTDPTITPGVTTAKRVHFQQLRDAVK